MSKYFLIILVLSNLVFSQGVKSSSFWGDAGAGLNYIKLANSDVMLNFRFGLNYKVNSNNFSVVYLNSSEFELIDSPAEYLKSVSVIYGRSFDFTMRRLLVPLPLPMIVTKEFKYSLVVKIGASYIVKRERTGIIQLKPFNNLYSGEVKEGMGLPLEIELREELTKSFGMSVSLYGNKNGIKDHWGFNFGIYIGQL